MTLHGHGYWYYNMTRRLQHQYGTPNEVSLLPSARAHTHIAKPLLSPPSTINSTQKANHSYLKKLIDTIKL